MANFGANILMQDAAMTQRNSEDWRNRLFAMAQMREDRRQFDEKMKHPPKMTEKEREVGLFKKLMSGNATPEDIATAKAYEGLGSGKTTWETGPHGVVREVPAPNPWTPLLEKYTQGINPAAGDPMEAHLQARGDRKAELMNMPAPRELTQDQFMFGDEGIERGAPTDSGLPEVPEYWYDTPEGVTETGKANIDVDKTRETEAIKTDEALREDQIKQDRVKAANLPTKLAENEILGQDIQRALDVLEDNSNYLPETGTIGSLLSYFSETSAGQLESYLKSVRNLVGFGKLGQMRENSPTGSSGLGALSENEMTGLQATSGNLEINQRSEDLSFNLKRLYNQQMDLVHGTPQHIANVAAEKNLPQELVDQLSFRYDLAENKTQNRDQLIKQAQDAINRGADPAAVEKRLKEMLNGQ